MKLNGTVLVVTGGGNGMGQQIALKALAKGARVATVDISEDGLATTRQLAGEAGDRLATFPLNLVDRAAVEALPAQVTEALGPPDIVVNCAVGPRPAPLPSPVQTGDAPE